MSYTGKNLIDWGFTPGPWFPDAITRANELAKEGTPVEDIVQALKEFSPPEKLKMRTDDIPEVKPGEEPVQVGFVGSG